jgi:ubiquinone/menaquinone biosynthesis C-methylase UbiE
MFEKEEARVRVAYTKRGGSERRYSWFNADYLYRMQERERRVLRVLTRYGCLPAGDKTVLEIGCGAAHWLREFVKWGFAPANVVGLDLLPDKISAARKLSPETLTLKCCSASKLEFRDATFDIVLQSMVFTSVLDTKLRQQIAGEMMRVLKPSGLVLWYDFYINNPKNHDVRGVKRKELYQLFPGCRIDLTRITLAPPLTRVLAPYSRCACQLLERLTIFNSHYLGVIIKRRQTRTESLD